MHPQLLSIKDFSYPLPDERIARYPLANRDESKLLMYRQGQISSGIFSELPDQLPTDSLLVFNNSRVVEARLLFEKPTGGLIEIFALEPHEDYADITTAMNACGSIRYKCMVGGASKWKAGMVLQKQLLYEGSTVLMEARMEERRSDCFVIQLNWTPADWPFAQILHLLGEIPIPPYLQRHAEASDAERYQTVYAQNDGSVAAPTAGLHFTPAVLQRVADAGIGQAFVTLHVGAGTFKPVKADTMQGHDMHAEFLDVPAELLPKLAAATRIIPVGTTSMRTLESLYWMGVKAAHMPDIELTGLEIQQWEVYDRWQALALPPQAALMALHGWLEKNNRKRLIIKTQIIIAPGYQFGLCKGLITNFHQPQSTLLLLVAALVGPAWKDIYQYALNNDFRFLSYGDSSLLLP
ncbi:MAG: S-adenosylmethionine:tRNA ribosyltransferase-isomerase [Chitinophagaceae bacterium]|jgi:S-adenosylmethionine:tRNA ribosyltransferase-isomerase|nr:S-adenosylmethionine:tRNA ribosyltransferase-isomerase [Chitinophagaceae bacterium]